MSYIIEIDFTFSALFLLMLCLNLCALCRPRNHEFYLLLTLSLLLLTIVCKPVLVHSLVRLLLILFQISMNQEMPSDIGYQYIYFEIPFNLFTVIEVLIWVQW